MALSKSTELIKHFDNLIHQDTQQQKLCVDLTLDEVHKFTGAGSLDFGGSEFKAAQTQKVMPEKKNEGDDYGWWSLDGGIYRAVCNESVKDFGNRMVLVVPHKHAKEAGVIVNSIIADATQDSNPIQLLFHTPDTGCNIKENARFASVYMLSKQKGLGQSIT